MDEQHPTAVVCALALIPVLVKEILMNVQNDGEYSLFYGDVPDEYVHKIP